MPRCLTREEAAGRLRISVESFDALVSLKKLPGPLGLNRRVPMWDGKAVVHYYAEHRKAAPGTVYVIGFLEYAKIGWTSGLLEVRCAAIQESVPLPLEVYGSFKGDMKDERRVHRRFAPLRLSGEWFKKEGDLSQWVADGCNPELIGLGPRF